MARKSKAKFKMKGHSIPGIKGFKGTAMPDGRAASSAFQMQEAGDSPNKFVGAGLIGAGIGALSKTKFGKGIGKGLGKIGKGLLGPAGQLFGGGGGEEEGSDAAAGAELLKAEAKEAMEEGSPVTMKSPYKNYKNPQDYKVFNMGNEPTPVKKNLRTGTRSTVGGDLGGNAYSPESPFNQVPLQPAEHEDTYVYDGDNPQEIIADLEDRIGFIKEDISNTDGNQTEDQRAALELLNAHLEKLYKEEGFKPKN